MAGGGVQAACCRQDWGRGGLRLLLRVQGWKQETWVAVTRTRNKLATLESPRQVTNRELIRKCHTESLMFIFKGPGDEEDRRDH